jgi:hypothetical protein
MSKYFFDMYYVLRPVILHGRLPVPKRVERYLQKPRVVERKVDASAYSPKVYYRYSSNPPGSFSEDPFNRLVLIKTKEIVDSRTSERLQRVSISPPGVCEKCGDRVAYGVFEKMKLCPICKVETFGKF